MGDGSRRPLLGGMQPGKGTGAATGGGRAGTAETRRDGIDRYLTSHRREDLGADDRKDTWHGALRVCGSLESRREGSGEWRPPADEAM